MTVASVLQYALFLIILTALVRPAGVYMQRVFERQRTWLDPVLGPVERAIYRVSGIDPESLMD